MQFNSNEENLNNLMEECLRNKEYEVMFKALQRVKATYSQHGYYDHLLQARLIEERCYELQRRFSTISTGNGEQ